METPLSHFVQVLNSFREGETTFGDLSKQMRQLLSEHPEQSGELRKLLDDCFEQGYLPPQIQQGLIAQTTLSLHNADNDDETRISTSSDEQDETIVRPTTKINTPKPGEVIQPNVDFEKIRLTDRFESTDQRGAVSSVDITSGETINTTRGTRYAGSSGFNSSETEKIGIGSVLKDRFILEELLGSGGMGVVYKALDLRKQEAQDKSPYVALKILNDEFKDNPTSYIALQRETRKAQTLAHPNIITVYDFDRDRSHIFMSMEVLTGQSLKDYINKVIPNGMPFKKAWHIIKGMCLALAYAHKNGIIHSDFKPGNVSILETGEVKVLDFGIACAVSRPDKDQDETVFDARRDLGALTPAYASLEMFSNKEPDPSDDVYALACVIYEILTGKHPYGKLSALKAYELNLQPKAVPSISRRQWKGLQRALALERKNRTPSVKQLITDLQPRSPLPIILGTIAVIAIAVTTGGYIKLSQETDPLQDKIIELTPKQQLKVKDLLELAEIHFEVGYLTAPTGSNALWSYRQALEIDPYNKEAKNGLKKIADILSQQARQLFAEGKYDESLAKIEEGLEAIPKHDELLALKKKILN